jgi:hypothetical protein
LRGYTRTRLSLVHDNDLLMRSDIISSKKISPARMEKGLLEDSFSAIEWSKAKRNIVRITDQSQSMIFTSAYLLVFNIIEAEQPSD